MFRSLERLLLVWVLGALGFGVLLLVLVSYLVTLDEFGEIFDDNLRQVALALVSQPDPTPEEIAARGRVVLPKQFEEDGQFDFRTLLWDRQGHLLASSEPGSKLPFSDVDGLGRVTVDGQAWHVYTIVVGERVVQAAQRAESRTILAAHAASKLLLPVGLLTLGIGGLLVIALRLGLRSLDLTARHVAARSSVSLEPVDVSRVPREIQPLIESINGLMRRVGEALSTQRRFIADAAHELRSPITALRLQLQNLERAGSSDGRAVAMEELRLGIERSQRLLVQLLDLSRLEPDEPGAARERIDLAALIAEVVVEHSREAERKQIDLGAETPDALWLVADGDALRVLLRNLVGNAIRYTQAGGRVDVIAKWEAARPVLEVVDNGPGIAAHETARVFDRFFRGESAQGATDGPGSGLGLAIVKAIADRHGATVVLDRPPTGTGLRARVIFGAHP